MERSYSSFITDHYSKPKAAVASPVKMEFGYPCAQCGALTSNRKIAKLHNDAHCTGYACSFCPQVFFTEHVLTVHEGIHKKMRKTFVEDNCQCKVCEAAFLSLLYLEFHLVQFHGEDVLKNPSVIRMDVIEERESSKLTDSRDKNYRCGYCLYLFEFAANLECHMTLHPNGKYECNKCPAKFSISESLQIHVNSKHHEIEETKNDFVDSRKIISKPLQIRGGVPKTMINCKWQQDSSAKAYTASSSRINQLHIRKALKLSGHQNFQKFLRIPFQEESQYANVVIYNLNLPKGPLTKPNSTRSDVRKDSVSSASDNLEWNEAELSDESDYINPYLIKVMLTTNWKGEENKQY